MQTFFLHFMCKNLAAALFKSRSQETFMWCTA